MVKYKVSDRFAALAEKNRLCMVELLMKKGPLPMSAFMRPLSISLPAVSKHAHVLAKAGLIRQEKMGRENMCALNPEAFQDTLEWFLSHQQFWNRSLDRLEQYITNVT